jgi:hypothetical protein
MTHLLRSPCGTAILLAGIAAAACGGGGTTSAMTASAPTSPTTGTSGGAAVNTSAMYSQFGKAATVTLDAQTAVIRTTDVPDHPTP